MVQRNNYNNIKALAVSKKELNNWIQATDYNEKYFTIPQIAKILNISQQLAYQLVNKKLMDCVEDKDTRKRLITKESLTNFEANYIFLSKISIAIKESPKILIDYLAYKGIFPVDNLWQAKLKNKIYLKKQLKNDVLIKGMFINDKDSY